MRYCLDTNTIVYFLKGTHPGIRARVDNLAPRDIAIPEVVCAELIFGAMKSQKPRRNLQRVEAFLAPFEKVPFGGEAVVHYAEIRLALERAGRPIGPNDLLIAATTRALGAILVTHNLAEFSRVPRLRVEDWTQA